MNYGHKLHQELIYTGFTKAITKHNGNQRLTFYILRHTLSEIT